jgi:polar amino acid transport system substrate-binding protein
MKRLLILCMTFLFATIAHCDEPIKVGVLLGPPFVIKQESIYTGIAIELWTAVTQNLKKTSTYVEFSCSQSEAAFEALQKGEIEVLIGPLSVTGKTLEVADFTLPYFIDKIIVLSSYEYFHNIIHFLKILLYSIGGIIFLFFSIFIAYIHLLWYFEHPHGTNIPNTYKEGISYLFWTHIFIGHHDDLPITWPGKILLLFKTGSFYVILTVLNATLISTLAISFSRWNDPIQDIIDLEKHRVGAIVNSRPSKIGKELGLKIYPFGSIEEGVQALEGKQIGAFLADLSQADTYLKGKGLTDITINHYDIRHDLYSFATRHGNPLLRDINLQMVALRKNGTPQKICQSYLSKGVTNCEL